MFQVDMEDCRKELLSEEILIEHHAITDLVADSMHSSFGEAVGGLRKNGAAADGRSAQ